MNYSIELLKKELFSKETQIITTNNGIRDGYKTVNDLNKVKLQIEDLKRSISMLSE